MALHRERGVGGTTKSSSKGHTLILAKWQPLSSSRCQLLGISSHVWSLFSGDISRTHGNMGADMERSSYRPGRRHGQKSQRSTQALPISQGLQGRGPFPCARPHGPQQPCSEAHSALGNLVTSSPSVRQVRPSGQLGSVRTQLSRSSRQAIFIRNRLRNSSQDFLLSLCGMVYDMSVLPSLHS